MLTIINITMKFAIYILVVLIMVNLLSCQTPTKKRKIPNNDSLKMYLHTYSSNDSANINHRYDIDSFDKINYIIIKYLNPYATYFVNLDCIDLESEDSKIIIYKYSKQFKSIDSLYSRFINVTDSVLKINHYMDMRVRIENYDINNKLLSVICSNYSNMFYFDVENIYAVNPKLNEYLFKLLFKWKVKKGKEVFVPNNL